MRSQDLYEQAKKIIPGGTQLLSKRPEMFLPNLWPAYYSSAKGVEVTDLDGRSFVDMSIMGVGACILGYSDVDVDGSVREAIAQGSMSTLNAPEEVEYFSRKCLIARRLLERGVRFVQLFHMGWDHHYQLPSRLRQKAAEIDRPCAALIASPWRRGTSVLWWWAPSS